MAGGGIKGGTIYGATDEIGYAAAENPVSYSDLHATILHLLGVDVRKLTYWASVSSRPQDDRIDWISMMVPEGNNWIEFIVWRDPPPNPQQLGVWHHVCVGTLDIQRLYIREPGPLQQMPGS